MYTTKVLNGWKLFNISWKQKIDKMEKGTPKQIDVQPSKKKSTHTKKHVYMLHMDCFKTT